MKSAKFSQKHSGDLKPEAVLKSTLGQHSKEWTSVELNGPSRQISSTPKCPLVVITPCEIYSDSWYQPVHRLHVKTKPLFYRVGLSPDA